MGFYNSCCLPYLTNWTCASSAIRRQREKIVGLAEGVVVEVGMGPGLNLPHYDATKIERVFGVEPEKRMQHLAAARLYKAPFPVEWVEAGGEDMPLESDIADTILITYTLCTIPARMEALAEMQRVLKPGGKLLFCEHGLSPEPRVERLQNWMTPLWKRLAGGCHLNIDISGIIEESGFVIDHLECSYFDRPKFATYQYLGVATV